MAGLELLTDKSGVVLRQFKPIDSIDIFTLIDANREHLSENGEDTASKYRTIDDVAASINRPKNPDRLRLGIWDDYTLVGSINLTPIAPKTAEIGYYLGAQFIGKGYMAAAVQTLTDYALGNGFEEVHAYVAPSNVPSRNVLLRAGYVEFGPVENDSKKILFSKKR